MKTILRSVLLLMFAGLLISSQTHPAVEKRFEIGGHFVFLQRQDASTLFELSRERGTVSPDYNPAVIDEFGLGARLGFNFTKHFALEGEINGFPQNKINSPVPGDIIEVFEPGGRKLQIVGGPKVGFRKQKFGVFAKARPGVIGMDRYDVVVAAGPPKNPFILSQTRSPAYFFNIDLGGVFELYPSKRTIVRFDAGDTWIFYRSFPPKEINLSMQRHNLQISAGFGFRF